MITIERDDEEEDAFEEREKRRRWIWVFRERKLRYLRPSEFMVSLCIFIFVCFNGLTFYSCNSNNI